MPCLVGLLNNHVASNRINHECGKEESGLVNKTSPLPTTSTKTVVEQSKTTAKRRSVILDIGNILDYSNANNIIDAPNELLSDQTNTSITESLQVSENTDNEDSMESLKEEDECVYNQKIDCILQIMLRMYENPPLSESLTDINTAKIFVQYLCWTKYDPVTHRRAGLIISRLSKRLETIMPFLLQAFFPWLRLEADSRLQNSDLGTCVACQTLSNLFNSVIQDFIFTAESGYIEGNVCHKLVAPGAADENTRSVISVGIVSLITCKTLLFNILITHGGLEVLLQTLETEATKDVNAKLFSYTVLSLKLLSQRVEVVSSIDDRPLKLDKCQQTEDLTETNKDDYATEDAAIPNSCLYKRCKREKKLLLTFDDGSAIRVNKDILVAASNVFEAMLLGRFSEANQNAVHLPKTSSSAMLRIVHYLYGCRRWAGSDGCCRYSPGLSGSSDDRIQSSGIISQYEDNIEMLLDLVPLSDKYLLTDLNIIASRMIIMQCTQNPEGKMKIAYRRSLNIICPTTDNIKNDGDSYVLSGVNLNQDAATYSSAALNVQLASFLLAGDIQHDIRVQLFRELAKPDSGIASDFVDDISQIITSSLKKAMRKPRPIAIKQKSTKMMTQ